MKFVAAPGPFVSIWLVRAALVVLLSFVAAPALAACTVSSSVTTTLGTYSPAAVATGAEPALQSRAGLTCPTAVLTVLGNNYMRATFRSQNGLVLKQQSGSASVAYTASADPSGNYVFGQGTTIDYMQNNLLNVLGLLGGSSADLPFYIKPARGTTLPAGSYTDRITINWSWYECSLVGALNACVGTLDSGSGTATIDVTLVVATNNVVLSVTNVVTWDPVNGTTKPRPVPGGKERQSVTATNPDIVPLDGSSVALVIPTPLHLIVALDGDGTSNSTVFGFTDGSPASGVALTYKGPGDTTDDVDFSSDGGVTWNYVPTAGNVASEAAITHVRLRPHGTMAKQSNFSISLPYLVS